MDDRGARKIIDCHNHVFGPEGVRQIDIIREDQNIDSVNVLSISAIKPFDHLLSQNLLGLLCKAHKPGKTYAFAALTHPPFSEEPYEEQADRLSEAGFDGFKMIEGKPVFRRSVGRRLDSGIFDGFYRYLEKRRLPLLLHAADPDSFWDDPEAHFSSILGVRLEEGPVLSKEAIYRETEGILQKFPDLRLILAHFYFMAADIERASRFLEQYRNVSFDLTPGREMYDGFASDIPAWRDFFNRYQNRILFGTDNSDEGAFPERRKSCATKVLYMRSFLESDGPCEYFGRRERGLGLSDAVLDKIYASNYIGYAGHKPREIDSSAAAQECRLVRALIESKSIPEDAAEILRRAENTFQQEEL